MIHIKITIQVLNDGAIPVIVVFPTRRDHDLYRNYGKKRYGALLDKWNKKDYNYFDLTDQFVSNLEEKEFSNIFSEGGHYNAQGTLYVARFLYPYLKRISIVNENNE